MAAQQRDHRLVDQSKQFFLEKWLRKLSVTLQHHAAKTKIRACAQALENIASTHEERQQDGIADSTPGVQSDSVHGHTHHEVESVHTGFVVGECLESGDNSPIFSPSLFERYPQVQQSQFALLSYNASVHIQEQVLDQDISQLLRSAQVAAAELAGANQSVISIGSSDEEEHAITHGGSPMVKETRPDPPAPPPPPCKRQSKGVSNISNVYVVSHTEHACTSSSVPAENVANTSQPRTRKKTFLSNYASWIIDF